MTRRVRWTRASLDDIEAQASFIARTTGRRLCRRRTGFANPPRRSALGDRPAGPSGRVAGTYEKSVARLPYVIAYALSEKAGDEAVVILRVIHTARGWAAGEWPE